MKKINKIIIPILILVVIIGLYVWFNKSDNTGLDNDLNNASTSAPVIDIGANSGNYTIEQVPIEDDGLEITAPDLNRQVVFDPNLDPEIKQHVIDNMKELKVELENNPKYYEAWLDWGLFQKKAGDYSGAVETWVYVSEIFPTDSVSVSNLADLYAHFIKDYDKAEFYYKESIKRNPAQVASYIRLSELYQYLMEDNDKATDILNQGLKQFPDNAEILNALNNI